MPGYHLSHHLIILYGLTTFGFNNFCVSDAPECLYLMLSHGVTFALHSYHAMHGIGLGDRCLVKAVVQCNSQPLCLSSCGYFVL